MNLTDATEQEIDHVLEGTRALWSDGLEHEAYAEFVRALRRTAWARAGSYRFVTLRGEGGRVLSAMKLYRFTARAGGRAVTLGGVGALFTPPEVRGRGHAARLLERAHDEMAARGDAAALLHSEIGAAYYRRFGYRALDPGAAWIDVPAGGAAAGDVPEIGRAHV